MAQRTSTGHPEFEIVGHWSHWLPLPGAQEPCIAMETRATAMAVMLTASASTGVATSPCTFSQV